MKYGSNTNSILERSSIAIYYLTNLIEIEMRYQRNRLVFVLRMLLFSMFIFWQYDILHIECTYYMCLRAYNWARMLIPCMLIL
jgi:hypothetical protein